MRYRKEYIADRRIDASNTPTFALGDASGVNTDITFLIMMIDTTSDKRVLHYLQPDFKATEDKTAIDSSTKPVQAYQAPGTLGDSGPRQYTFLMYQQKPGFKASGMPSQGSTFDVKSFASTNNLGDALAGIAMSVQVSGGSTSVTSASQPQVSQDTPSETTPITQTTAQQTTATVVALTTPATTVVAPTQPAVASQVTSNIAALPSTLSTAVPTNDIASVATVNPGGSVVGLSSIIVSAASAAPSVASGVASSVTAAGGSTATGTNSAAATQPSSGAVAHRGKAFASLPMLVFAGVLLA